jgi:hypothetical protein
MQLRLHSGLAIAVLLLSGPSFAAEHEAPDPPGEITVEDALEEPRDADDAADTRADNDPNDVGQRALDPEGEDSSPDSASAPR